MHYNEKTKHFIVYAVTIVVSVVLIFFGNRAASKDAVSFGDRSGMKTVRAEVLTITDRETQMYETDSPDPMKRIVVSFRAKITGGPDRGEIVSAMQSIDDFTAVQLAEVQAGDKVVLYAGYGGDGQLVYMLGDYLRTDSLIVLCAVFLLLLVFFGRRKGVNTIVSLVFTCLAIFAVFFPAVLSGYNIYAWSIAVCVFIIVMTLLIVNGAGRKTAATVFGCLGGVLVAGLLTLIMSGILKLTGYVDNESVYLIYLNQNNPIDLKAIIFAAIIIGAVGAIMDVSMSIASSLGEISSEVPMSSFSSLFRSGLSIGRDIMGTMANTLILAYIGSSLSVVLVLIAYNSSLLGLLNREMIVVEILQALVGSMGILSAIPLTAFASGILYTYEVVLAVAPAGEKDDTEDI